MLFDSCHDKKQRLKELLSFIPLMLIYIIDPFTEKVNATIDDEILSDHDATVPEICCEKTTNTDVNNITANNFSNPVNG